MSSSFESTWLDAFVTIFERCRMQPTETLVILCESQSREVNIRLAEAALGAMKLSWYKISLPSPAPVAGPIVRSSGACLALSNQAAAVRALADADVVIDLTVEGLMHARETATILKSGARIMTVSNEHPEALARLVPALELKDAVRAAANACQKSKVMRITSEAGTDLNVNMVEAATVGIWGWTDRPGTLAHWPGGLVVSFPKAKTVNGRLVFKPGDMNLTFKRYFESEITCELEDDYVTKISGSGADAALMRFYFEGFDDKLAYATSHVGWGLNPLARYEALTMYDKADTNGTELRAVAGNFLYSTGANEFANRFTRGHFDLPMMDCTIRLDGTLVVDAGKPV